MACQCTTMVEKTCMNFFSTVCWGAIYNALHIQQMWQCIVMCEEIYYIYERYFSCQRICTSIHLVLLFAPI